MRGVSPRGTLRAGDRSPSLGECCIVTDGVGGMEMRQLARNAILDQRTEQASGRREAESNLDELITAVPRRRHPSTRLPKKDGNLTRSRTTATNPPSRLIGACLRL
jgi:hypothetical protein